MLLHFDWVAVENLRTEWDTTNVYHDARQANSFLPLTLHVFDRNNSCVYGSSPYLQCIIFRRAKTTHKTSLEDIGCSVLSTVVHRRQSDTIHSRRLMNTEHDACHPRSFIIFAVVCLATANCDRTKHPRRTLFHLFFEPSFERKTQYIFIEHFHFFLVCILSSRTGTRWWIVDETGTRNYCSK